MNGAASAFWRGPAKAVNAGHEPSFGQDPLIELANNYLKPPLLTRFMRHIAVQTERRPWGRIETPPQ